MKRPIALLLIGTLLLSGITSDELQALTYGVETAPIETAADIGLHTPPNFDASPRQAARELEMAPYYAGTVHGFQVQEFFTESGDIAYNADGTLAKDAKSHQIPMPVDVALADEQAASGTRIPRNYNYKSYDGTAESGGEWWLRMWQLRQPAGGGRPGAPDYSKYYYGGIAFLVAVVIWRVRRVRQREMEDDLDTLDERTQGAYFQSNRGVSEDNSSVLRMASDDEAGPYSALIGMSPLKRITYQG